MQIVDDWVVQFLLLLYETISNSQYVGSVSFLKDAMGLQKQNKCAGCTLYYK